MNFKIDHMKLKKLSVTLGIIKGVISLALLTSIAQPDFKVFDNKLEPGKYGRRF